MEEFSESNKEPKEIIKDTRTILEMNQVDFAKTLSVSRQSVEYWETGKVIPECKYLYAALKELQYRKESNLALQFKRPKNWAKHLKSERQKIGVTQVKFGELLHASISSIKKWETGVSNPLPFMALSIEYIKRNAI